MRDVKIEGFHWHDLRHTFASRLAMAGVNLRTVQEALGHKSIAMTVPYSHLSPEYQLDAVERLVPKPRASLFAEETDTTTDTKPFCTEKAELAYVQ
jgi:site-specific recombinase XerC